MKQIKLGVFGLWRGGAFLPMINALDHATLWAVCDKDENGRATLPCATPPRGHR